jgi:hypothetical protein
VVIVGVELFSEQLDDEQLLLCGWHQRQNAQGQHLSHRCSSWRPPQHQQQGWAPEMG